MLTKDDVQKIGEVVDQKLDKKLDHKFDEKLAPIKRDIQAIGTLIDAKLAPIKRDLRYIKGVLNAEINSHREGFNNHDQRITRLENKVIVHETFKG